MKKVLITLFCLLPWLASGQSFIKDIQPYSVKMVLSEMARNPQASYLDGRAGALKWNYTTGLELKSFVDCARRYELDYPLQYAKDWADAITEGGVIQTYKLSNYNVDHICPARMFFDLYRITGDEHYKDILKQIRVQLDGQPRTNSGEFWHKKIYPYQVWLDGLYMALPFYSEYATTFEKKSVREESYKDIVHQFTAASKATKDPETGLFRHAWDESRSMFWCDPETGLSAHAWGRANGWYAIALVEVLGNLPLKHEGRAELIAQLEYLLSTVDKYSDPESGMWYQVLDCPGREGNYLESSASIMFVYAALKAANRRYLSEDWKEWAFKKYNQFLAKFVRENEDGTISITDCCAVAGLGGKENRAGDYAYYLSEPIIENDNKAVGPFIWASLEYEAAHNIDYVFDGNYIWNGEPLYEKPAAKEVAFSGAEGCGKYVSGGRGGKVYTVTTLEDDGSEGSFRYACEAKGARIVEFKVKGEIHLTSPLRISNPNISILGQTAPGEGITIRDNMVYIETDNVIVRYMRFRMGAVSGVEDDSFGGRHCSGLMIDHCSVSWSTDENMSFYGNSNVTIQWCIISEALNASIHKKGDHGYGAIWGGRNVTFHHNLFIHNNSRNPRFDHPSVYIYDDILYRRGTVEFVNNVVYNWLSKAAYGGEEGWYNIVGNYWIPGPATKNLDGRYMEISTSPTTSNIPGSFYFKDNIYDPTVAMEQGRKPDWKKIALNEQVYIEKSVSKPFVARVQYTGEDPEKLVKVVAKGVGCSKSRDAIDKRLIKELLKGTTTYTGSVGNHPGIIDNESDVQ